MGKLPLIILLISTITACSAEMMTEPIRLKEGPYLYIRDDGTMRVVSENNKLISIKDGAELELVDGQLITMKNKTRTSILFKKKEMAL
jgi:hypothetical protein